jgi:TonB family protein
LCSGEKIASNQLGRNDFLMGEQAGGAVCAEVEKASVVTEDFMRPRSPRPRFLNDSLSTKWFADALLPKQAHGTDGAALHFEAIDLSARGGPARMVSVLAHVGFVSAAFLILSMTPGTSKRQPGDVESRLLPPIFASASEILSAMKPPSLGKTGSGGEHDLRLPTKGELAPSSSRPLLPPRMPENRVVALPVPPAVFDENAPTDVANVKHLGLPWMQLENDSAGLGKHHGIGVGPDGAMGDRTGGGAGEGVDPGAYANVTSMPTCQYCPSPAYTDQARKQKIQGHVLVEVLVGADGRARGVRVVKGLGLGLDENTVQTIQGWRFAPAKNAQHQAIAVWVTIESAFQLY